MATGTLHSGSGIVSLLGESDCIDFVGPLCRLYRIPRVPGSFAGFHFVVLCRGRESQLWGRPDCGRVRTGEAQWQSCSSGDKVRRSRDAGQHVKEKLSEDTKARVQTDVEQLELAHAGGGNLNPLWKTGWQFLTKQNVYLPYDSAIPLLGIFPGGENIYPHTHIQILNKNLHRTLKCSKKKPWEKAKCIFNRKWIKKLWQILVMENTQQSKRMNYWQM